MTSISKEWETIHSEREWGKYPSEPVIRFVARNYYKTDRTTIKILDFGCGQGANTWYLAREGFDVYAFDGALSAVDKTKKFLEKEGLNAQIEVLDAINIDYKDNFFDAIIDACCIGHNKCKDIETMYRNCYRVLKKGGKIFTMFFSTNTTGFSTGEKIENNTYNNIEIGPLSNKGIVLFFEEDEFKNILEKIGFKKICVDILYYTDLGEEIEYYVVQAEK